MAKMEILLLLFFTLSFTTASYISEFYSLVGNKPIQMSPSKLNTLDLSLLSNGQDGSLISLTNQVGVDIVPAKTPILLRQHQKFQFLVETVTIISDGKSISHMNKSLVVNAPPLFASQVLRKGGIDVRNVSSQCDSSFLSIDSLCLKILFYKYASYTRPWNHELHVHLISKAYHINDVKEIPDVWTDWNNQHKWKPKLPSKARLFVFEHEPSWYSLNRYRQSLSGSGFHDNDILLVTTFAKLEKFRVTFTLFVPCQRCTITLLPFLSLSSEGLKEVFNKVNRDYFVTVNTSVWTFNEDFLPLKTSLVQHLNSNDLFSRINPLSVEELLALRIIEMLINIFGSKIDDVSYRNSRIEVIKYLGTDFENVDFSMTYSPFNIRFIGCGDTFKIKRSYSALLASFDLYCWISIAIVIFLFAPITWSVLINNHILINSSSFVRPNFQSILVLTFDAILTMIKNVLEQSTPYPKSFTLNFQMKFLATSLLLGILVISNAYKNDSISTLISPVRFQPFQGFDDLVEYNYSIQAELEYVLFVEVFPLKAGAILEHFQSGSYITNHSYQTPDNFFGSFIAMQIDSIIKTFVQMLPHNLSVPRSVTKIYNNSFMQIDSIRTAFADKDIQANISEKNLTTILSTVKRTQSMNFLERCNKSAVLAYEPQIREYEYELRHQGFTKISVSNYVLLGSKIGFILHGWFPKFILFRIKFVEQSGIVDWWNGFVLKHLVIARAKRISRMFDASSTVKKKLSSSYKTGMSGNLLVIFVVYAAGCCIAFVFWSVEICCSFVKRAKST